MRLGDAVRSGSLALGRVALNQLEVGDEASDQQIVADLVARGYARGHLSKVVRRSALI